MPGTFSFKGQPAKIVQWPHATLPQTQNYFCVYADKNIIGFLFSDTAKKLVFHAHVNIDKLQVMTGKTASELDNAINSLLADANNASIIKVEEISGRPADAQEVFADKTILRQSDINGMSVKIISQPILYLICYPQYTIYNNMFEIQTELNGAIMLPVTLFTYHSVQNNRKMELSEFIPQNKLIDSMIQFLRSIF